MAIPIFSKFQVDFGKMRSWNPKKAASRLPWDSPTLHFAEVQF